MEESNHISHQFSESQKISTGIYAAADNFRKSRDFIAKKVIKDRLFCDECGCEFPMTIKFYIIVDEREEKILCYPCDYKRKGINIELENRKLMEEAKQSSMPKKEEIIKPKKEKKKKYWNQQNLQFE